jgi:uncharacterized protein YbjT (DUF2867 family)
MIVVLGASGHTGNVVAQKLLAGGQQVRAVARNAQHIQPLAAKGAQIATADVTDAAALIKAFEGAHAAYVLIPPNPGADDPLGYQNRVIDAIVAAIRNARIQHVVALSSIGADKPSGTGPVVGLHNLEGKLNAIEGANVLSLRAGYFMENTLPQVNVIRSIGNVVGPFDPKVKFPLIATRDIGAAAADALMRRDFSGKTTHELQGQRDIDQAEVASIIGKAIGKPSLGYVKAPDEQLRPAFQQMGMSATFAGLLLEMAHALNSGYMKALEPRSPANTTPTSFETFVNEQFVPAYRQPAAA